jgi:lysozyme
MQERTGNKKPLPPLVALVGTIAASVLLVTIPKDEGTEYRAYKDIVSTWTVCSGDTANVRPGMVETPEGCRKRLEHQLIAHAEPVLKCVPWLAAEGRDYPRAASVSLAYNIGTTAFCRSTAAKRFNAGDWRGGCDAFLMWTKAGGKEVRGLRLRRERERALCLRGLK